MKFTTVGKNPTRYLPLKRTLSRPVQNPVTHRKPSKFYLFLALGLDVPTMLSCAAAV